ncbi:unnamed protein product [Callosobruchus maculatus]|uniref:Uncharacterized protein n=1 Tax=Callosobruchus maculatus TaxID=64391 RepID=A0A653CB11_CALMS|nr:unnamed protein product [Callosobruchus maculatus]
MIGFLGYLADNIYVFIIFYEHLSIKEKNCFSTCDF